MVNSYQVLLALFSFLTVVVIVGWLRAMFYDLLNWLSFLLTLPLAFSDNTCCVLLLSLCRICFPRQFINALFTHTVSQVLVNDKKDRRPLLLGTPPCVAGLIFFHVTLRVVLKKVVLPTCFGEYKRIERIL